MLMIHEGSESEYASDWFNPDNRGESFVEIDANNLFVSLGISLDTLGSYLQELLIHLYGTGIGVRSDPTDLTGIQDRSGPFSGRFFYYHHPIRDRDPEGQDRSDRPNVGNSRSLIPIRSGNLSRIPVGKYVTGNEWILI